MKISRAICLWILLAGSARASSWSDLWYRRDQQGQHALQAGDSKRAAELFTDPRRQAYAQLQGEQYGAAAERLAPFIDAVSQYNRGNALAKSGDLQGAIRAYDGALKHSDLESSLRRDAQHNRDLVARQLQTQKDQQHPSSGQQPPSKAKESGKPQGNESNDASGAAGSSTPPAMAESASPSQGKENKPTGDDRGGAAPASPSQPSPSSPTPSNAREGQREADENRQSTEVREASSPERTQEPAVIQQANGRRPEKTPGPVSRSGAQQSNSREPGTATHRCRKPSSSSPSRSGCGKFRMTPGACCAVNS